MCVCVAALAGASVLQVALYACMHQPQSSSILHTSSSRAAAVSLRINEDAKGEAQLHPPKSQTSQVSFASFLCKSPSQVSFASLLCKSPLQVSFSSLLRKSPLQVSFASLLRKSPLQVSFASLLCESPLQVSFASLLRKSLYF